MLADQAAERLRRAYDGSPIAPIAAAFADASAAHAYAIQELNSRLWLSEGRRLVGRKIGLTSAAVQKQLGVDQPDYGLLFEDMAVADGGTTPFSRLLQPKIEAEVAFVMGQDLVEAPGDLEAFAAAVEVAAPALEIVDSRIADWKITLFDTIADNASSALFVLGAERRPLRGLDLVGCVMTLTADGETVSTGTGGACMGSPLAAGLWLARTMAEAGRPLRAGDIVMSGALGPMAIVAPGVRYQATIGGLGSVSVTFAA